MSVVKVPSYLTAVACAVLLLVGQAGFAAQTVGPDVQVQFERAAPAGFVPQANASSDYNLIWRGQLKADIVWVALSDKPDTFVLEPASIPSFRKMLLAAGFDVEAVRNYLRFSSVQTGKSYCLSLAAAPEQCVNVTLRVNDQKQLELLADDRSAQLSPAIEFNELSLVGSSYFYFGEARSRVLGNTANLVSRTTSAGMAHRGVVSEANSRFEYDVSATSAEQASPSKNKTVNSLRFNILAAGVPVGGGMGFAGLSRSASGGQAFFGGGAQDLFAKPAQIGVAWQSNNGNLSSAQRMRRVLVQLQNSAFVRIVSDGVQLYEGNLPAGDNLVPFTGFAGAFVDVVVRDPSGREQVRSTEVQVDFEPDTQTVSSSQTRSLWYVDVGRVMDNRQTDNWRLKLSNTLQASASYTYLGDELLYQVAGQSVNGILRTGLGLSDRDYRWRASALVGLAGEYGVRFGVTPHLGALRFGLTLTEYAPPASGGTVVADCQDTGNNFCLSSFPDGFRSVGLGASMRGLPISLNMQYARSGSVSSMNYSLNSAVALPSLARGVQLMTSASYSPDSGAKSLNMGLMIPLDDVRNGSGYLSTNISTNFDGNQQFNTGVSRGFDPQQEKHIRSVSSGVQQSLSKDGERRTSGTVQVGSQFGVVANSTNLSQDNAGSAAINTSFSAQYGVSRAGLAFAKESQNIAVYNLFSATGQAGVSVINRSQEEQTVSIRGQATVVPPNSNILISTGQGLVRDISVTPGPVANEESVRAGRLLYKGNIKSLTIDDGFWVIAKFYDASNIHEKALPVEFSYKRVGEKLERLYASPTGEALLFEFRNNGEYIERFITLQKSKKEYRCLAKAADIPAAGDVSSYKEMAYACTLLDSGELMKADSVPAVQFIAQPSPTELMPMPVSSVPAEPIFTESPAAQVSVHTQPAIAPIPLAQAIEKWRQAWQSQDISAYLSWYAPDFRPAPQYSKNIWAEKRRAVFVMPKSYVNLKITNLTVTSDQAGQWVAFEQSYRADNYADHGRKIMLWRFVDEQWRIYSENFVPQLAQAR